MIAECQHPKLIGPVRLPCAYTKEQMRFSQDDIVIFLLAAGIQGSRPPGVIDGRRVHQALTIPYIGDAKRHVSGDEKQKQEYHHAERAVPQNQKTCAP